jgi:hypothetical protein
MRRFTVFVLSCSTLFSSFSNHASQLQPQTGLWRSQHQVLVNGEDILKQMQALQSQVLAAVPAEQRALVAGMMPKKDLSTAQECLTAAEVALLKTPQQWLSRAKQQLPRCQLQLTGSTANSVSVKGQCQDQGGYTGSLQGTVTLKTPQLMQMNMQGTGRYKMPLPGQAQNGDVQFKLSSESRWQSASCPAGMR